jgi:uncharacterized glyoxalase superfamily protein PhnB
MGITIHASFLPHNDPDALTADLDGTFARLQASGADVVQEPTQQPYGVRDCAFRNPAGNQIRINEPR